MVNPMEPASPALQAPPASSPAPQALPAPPADVHYEWPSPSYTPSSPSSPEAPRQMIDLTEDQMEPPPLEPSSPEAPRQQPVSRTEPRQPIREEAEIFPIRQEQPRQQPARRDVPRYRRQRSVSRSPRRRNSPQRRRHRSRSRSAPRRHSPPSRDAHVPPATQTKTVVVKTIPLPRPTQKEKELANKIRKEDAYCEAYNAFYRRSNSPYEANIRAILANEAAEKAARQAHVLPKPADHRDQDGPDQAKQPK